MGDGERHSEKYSGEYYWLVPKIMKNTRGRCIPILPAFLITPAPMVILTSTNEVLNNPPY